MDEILVVQHAEPEKLGRIADALSNRQLQSRFIRPFAGEEVPHDLGGAAGLILMGGPMGVYESDRFPFLRDEGRLIEAALIAGTPVLGICLGSQLLAAVLGAEIKKGDRKEIGWHRVKLAPEARVDPLFCDAPREFTAFHWHGDVFSLPAGAQTLASSDLTTHQAFRHGSAYGLLFHMEVTEALVEAMTETFAQEATEAGVDTHAIRRVASDHLSGLGSIGASIFDRWCGLLSPGKNVFVQEDTHC